MTPPMTPREKVRQIIDDALNSAIPEPWEVANHATDRILTALASGSGDHSGGVTDMVDHAELARLVDDPAMDFGGFGRSRVSALLAENAALRERLETARIARAAHNRQNGEAERKLADARLNYEGALSDIDSLLTVLIRRINGEKDLASAAEWVRLNYPLAAEKIISKEAERG